jgi:hypothetical protein
MVNVGNFKKRKSISLKQCSDTALFYDENGNAIGNNPIINSVFPNILNTFEDRTFSFNVLVNNDLNGINPLYIV